MERLKEIPPLLLPELSHCKQTRGFATADDCSNPAKLLNTEYRHGTAINTLYLFNKKVTS